MNKDIHAARHFTAYFYRFPGFSAHLMLCLGASIYPCLAGSLATASSTVNLSGHASFAVTSNTASIKTDVAGCASNQANGTNSTAMTRTDCVKDSDFTLVPEAPSPTLSFTPLKTLRFNWSDVIGASYYKLMEKPDEDSDFSQIGSDIPPDTRVFDLIVPLYERLNAQYLLRACSGVGCTDSAIESVSRLIRGIAYRQDHSSRGDVRFGSSESISADGNTLVVGAPLESSDATGINGDEDNNAAAVSGAVYVFERNGDGWSKQAYLKASNTESADYFGSAVSISADGNTLAVGAYGEDSSATGVNGNQHSAAASSSGAVYVFSRNAAGWSQQAYVKAGNTSPDHCFGKSVKVSADGNTLVVRSLEGAAYFSMECGDSIGYPVSRSTGQVFVRTDATWLPQDWRDNRIAVKDDY